jgi:ribosomal protein S12
MPDRKNSTAKRQSQKITAVDSQRRSLILNGISVKPKRSMSARKAANVNTTNGVTANPKRVNVNHSGCDCQPHRV